MKKPAFHISFSDIFYWKGKRKRLPYFFSFLCLKLLAVIIGFWEMKTELYLLESEIPVIFFIIPSIFFLLIGLFLIYLFFCNNAKRMHDLGLKTYWAFLVTLFIEISYTVVSSFTAEEKADNAVLYYSLLVSVFFLAFCLFLKKGKSVDTVSETITEKEDIEAV